MIFGNSYFIQNICLSISPPIQIKGADIFDRAM